MIALLVKEQILENKIVAIIRGVDLDHMNDTVGALLKGGINLVELAINHESDASISETLASLKLVKRTYGDKVLLGAGTVLTTDQVKMAVDAGAEYIISPGKDLKVIEATKSLDKISIPGALTPSEITEAYYAGADFIKIFPAGALGIDYIKAVRAPLAHIPLIAVGGVDMDNMTEFLDSGVVGVGIGISLVDTSAVYNENYEKIERLARQYVAQTL
ncbi:MAG: bifunctional 4-hydroxy-2-oxoglutarate aldolase/2-dehydro-3-deoxy-phosphogluconate aldolase [Firmicutes bacterium]|nr:bifunctional 4-hydroxy-2-oxoglutarate aldolase/2-dehydro-3-deoxy-phosphogluconate aldolase [Bacillota bacterium]